MLSKTPNKYLYIQPSIEPLIEPAPETVKDCYPVQNRGNSWRRLHHLHISNLIRTQTAKYLKILRDQLH